MQRQFLAQLGERPLVADDVVHLQQQPVARRVIADQLDLEQGRLGQVEGAVILDAQQALEMLASLALRDATDGALLQGKGCLGQHFLAGFAVDFDETGAQHAVALDQGDEGLLQGLDIQFAVEQKGAGQVVSGGKRCQALQEPQALLGKREQLRTVMDTRHERVELGLGVALQQGKQRIIDIVHRHSDVPKKPDQFCGCDLRSK